MWWTWLSAKYTHLAATRVYRCAMQVYAISKLPVYPVLNLLNACQARSAHAAPHVDAARQYPIDCSTGGLLM